MSLGLILFVFHTTNSGLHFISKNTYKLKKHYNSTNSSIITNIYLKYFIRNSGTIYQILNSGWNKYTF